MATYMAKLGLLPLIKAGLSVPSRGAKSSFVPPNDYIHQFRTNATVVEDLNTNDTAEDSRNETEIDMGSGESLMWTSFAMVDVSLGAMNVVVSGLILLLVMLIYCKATRILPGWFQDLETYNLSLLNLNKQHLEQLADVKWMISDSSMDLRATMGDLERVTRAGTNPRISRPSLDKDLQAAGRLDLFRQQVVLSSFLKEGANLEENAIIVDSVESYGMKSLENQIYSQPKNSYLRNFKGDEK